MDDHDAMDARHLKHCRSCRKIMAEKAWAYAKEELEQIYGDWF